MLSALDLMVQQSVELLVVRGEEYVPVSCGTGCIVKYRNKFFLLTVAHVTDYADTSTCIVLNKTGANGQPMLYGVGAMNYFDEYRLAEDRLNDIRSLDELLSDFNETIDMSFCELKEQIEIVQPEVDFGITKVEKSFKLYIDLDLDAGAVSKEGYYGFSGAIRHKKESNRLKRVLTLKYDLRFYRSKGRYDMFLAPQVISDADDYRGCSGAPILDADGKVVGFAASVQTNTKIVLGIRLAEVIRLLNYQLDIEALEGNTPSTAPDAEEPA